MYDYIEAHKFFHRIIENYCKKIKNAAAFIVCIFLDRPRLRNGLRIFPELQYVPIAESTR